MLLNLLHDWNEDIISMSVLAGGIYRVIWLALAATGRKRCKQEELEEEMREYFRR